MVSYDHHLKHTHVGMKTHKLQCTNHVSSKQGEVLVKIFKPTNVSEPYGYRVHSQLQFFCPILLGLMDMPFMLMSVIIHSYQYVAHSKTNTMLIVNMSLISVFLTLTRVISWGISDFTVLPTKVAACAAIFFCRVQAA